MTRTPFGGGRPAISQPPDREAAVLDRQPIVDRCGNTIPTQSLAKLAAHWREEACILRRRAAVPQAEVLETCAAELDAAIRSEANVLVSLAQAAAHAGYSADHLRRLARQGRVPVSHQGRRLCFRLGDLPIRPAAFDGQRREQYDHRADARQVIAPRSRGGSS